MILLIFLHISILFADVHSVSLDPSFRATSYRLMEYLTRGNLRGQGKAWMEEICDDFGPRLAGTMALENAIDAIVQKLKIDGFDNVHTEPVPGIPRFVRGQDRATIIAPRRHELNILAIPNTPPGRVRAQVVVLDHKDQLGGADVYGKIVVFCQDWVGYSWTVGYRKMSDEVARHGAVGLLVKSITPFSLGSPHTGRGGSAVPAASITVEEAEMLKRWSRRGKTITIEMDIRSRTLPNPVISRNTIFDIRGSRYPNEVVLISAHLDSWDIGQGALDDAGGCAAILHAMKAIKELSERDHRFIPKRTIRGIFWTAEEQGFLGAKQYYADHGQMVRGEKFVFVSETDNGAFKPTNSTATLAFSGTRDQMDLVNEIISIINAYGIPLKVMYSNSQGDVQSFADEGVPSVMYISDKGWEFYFNFHHSAADYANQISDEDIDYTAAIYAVLAHVISDMPDWTR